MDCGGNVIDMQISYNAFDVYKGSDWDADTQIYIDFVEFYWIELYFLFIFSKNKGKAKKIKKNNQHSDNAVFIFDTLTHTKYKKVPW